jgi:hypothetical protein
VFGTAFPWVRPVSDPVKDPLFGDGARSDQTRYEPAVALRTPSFHDGSSRLPSSKPPPGSTNFELNNRLGKFELLAKLGTGGMGEVYRAREHPLDRIVALKTIRHGYESLAEVQERFLREAKTVAALSHPHILKIHEYGTTHGIPFITMDLAEGGNLESKLTDYRNDLRAGVAMLAKVADALAHVHQKNLIHRDLKPSNILFDSGGEPYISDFGLACFADGSSRLTVEGQVLGTPAYMAPEQASGRADLITPRSDIWSLGVILFEMATGRRPFDGPKDEILRALLTGSVPKPRSIVPTLDPYLEKIILHCLERDPANRYSTADDLATHLRRWVDEGVVRFTPSAILYKYVRRTAKNRWAQAAAAAVVVVLIALLVGVFALPDPFRAIRSVFSDLKRGRSVTLIGETGPPRWHRSWVGQYNLDYPSQDRVIRISAGRESALELLYGDLPPRYTVSCEFRSTQPYASVGLFIGHAFQSVNDRNHHRFFRYVVDYQVKENKGKGLPYGDVTAWCEPGGDELVGRIVKNPFSFTRLQRTGPLEPSAWMRLSLQVTEQATSFSVNDQHVATISLSELRDRAKELLLTTPGFPYHVQSFPTSETGLGIWLSSNSEVQVRNFVVTPLVP